MPIQLNNLRPLVGVLMVAARLTAADPGRPQINGKAAEETLARQRQAIESMATSLEVQRRSLRTQLGRMPEQPFFTLPPLSPLPASPAPRLEPAFECPPLPSPEIDSLVEEAARHEDLEAGLLRSVIRQESGARPCAVSPKGAVGLMQLMPATAAQLGVNDAFDPKENVEGGARLLKQLLKMYGGDVSLALGAFNAGPGKVNQAGGLPNIPETIDYVQKVLGQLP